MNSTFWRLISQLRSFKLLTFLVVVVTVVSASSIPVGLALGAMILSRAGLHAAMAELGGLYLAIRLVAIMRGSARYAERLWSHDLALRVLPSWRERIYLSLCELVPGSFPEKNQGAVLERSVFDVDSIVDFYIRGLLPYVGGVSSAVALVGLSLIFDPNELIAVGAMLLLMISTLAIRDWKASDEFRQEESESASSLKTCGIDLVIMKEEMHFTPGTDWLRTKLISEAEASARTRHINQASTLQTTSLIALIPIICGIAALMVGLGFQGISNGMFIVVPLAMIGSSETFSQVGASRSALRSSIAAAERVLLLSQRRPPRQIPLRIRPPSAEPMQIEMSGVSFSHPNGPQVLSNVDFRIEPGVLAGIQGASGSGKTTLLNLLTGHLLPDSGTVMLNGISSAEMDPEALSQLINYIPQHAHLFDATVRYNVTLGRPSIDDDAVKDALERLGLSKWFARLPDGLDTLAGSDNGFVPSGGELQRLALARTLVGEPCAVVLDEPGSSLDERSKSLLLETIRSIFHSVPIIYVSHSRYELERMDQVWALCERSLLRIR